MSFCHRFIRLTPEGHVVYSQRLTVSLPCSVQSAKYPLDEESCHLNFSSFSRSKYLSYKWAEWPISVADIRSWVHSDSFKPQILSKPIIVVPRLMSNICEISSVRMSQHSLVSWALGPDSDSSSYLHLQLNLRRQIGYYMLQVIMTLELD